MLRRAAERLQEQRDDLEAPVYLLINGDIEIVKDEQAVTAALREGGALLAYHTGKALRQVEELRVA
jgi:hypothetical protein